jgi:hypothetical protein
MPAVRALLLTGVVVAAVVLKVAVFSLGSFDGVFPDLALVVVVAAAHVRGPEVAATTASGTNADRRVSACASPAR